MKIFKIISVSIAIFAILVLSELVYIFNNPGTFEIYMLNIVRQVSAAGYYNFGFYILTEGKYKLPDNDNYKAGAKKILENLPPAYTMSRTLYDLSLLAWDNNLSELTDNLLSLAVKHDPNLSFWAVELSNYFLANGDVDSATMVLDKCMILPDPRKHCNEFLENNVKSNTAEPVGFLKDEINAYYEAGYR